MPARQLDDDERRDWLRLARTENVGPATFRQLIARYGTAADALAALPDLSRRGGLNRPIRICSRQAAERDLAAARAMAARFIASCEPDYPPLLRQTDTAPGLVCVKGDAGLLARPTIAVVGARNASAAGRRLARDLAGEFGRAGLVVVSGLALGIDAAAHEAALATGTAAVLAGGLDIVYPPQNAALHEAIAGRGCLLSEMAPGTVPRAEHFPRRNRLIAGMGLGVVVVEAAMRSGSLITARLALEQNREVFAVPGSPLDPRAEGTNRLIKQGATLVTSARDVLDVLAGLVERADRHEPFGADGLADPHGEAGLEAVDGDHHAHVLALLGPAPVELDDLIRESGLTPAVVTAVVLELEIAGKLERHPGQRVARLLVDRC